MILSEIFLKIIFKFFVTNAGQLYLYNFSKVTSPWSYSPKNLSIIKIANLTQKKLLWDDFYEQFVSSYVPAVQFDRFTRINIFLQAILASTCRQLNCTREKFLSEKLSFLFWRHATMGCSCWRWEEKNQTRCIYEFFNKRSKWFNGLDFDATMFAPQEIY